MYWILDHRMCCDSLSAAAVNCCELLLPVQYSCCYCCCCGCCCDLLLLWAAVSCCELLWTAATAATAAAAAAAAVTLLLLCCCDWCDSPGVLWSTRYQRPAARLLAEERPFLGSRFSFPSLIKLCTQSKPFTLQCDDSGFFGAHCSLRLLIVADSGFQHWQLLNTQRKLLTSDLPDTV